MSSTLLYQEVRKNYSLKYIANKFFLHEGTIKRWEKMKKVPDIYFNDLCLLADKKHNNIKVQDQFFTNKEVSTYCYKKTLNILSKLSIDPNDYVFIEPSAGCCNFYNLLPIERRIGIDLFYKKKGLIQKNYLEYFPKKNNNYIVVGNPPFGLRGNLALRFINHSHNFADVVAFILPPLFDSDGKGVPKKRVVGYELAHSEKLPLNSFIYPNGKEIKVATIFQVWTKLNIHQIKKKKVLTCKDFIKVYSFSDGGAPSNTRNKDKLYKCDVYLPSTCFKGMRAYLNFEDLPHRRGYGVIIHKEKNKIKNLFLNKIKWNKIAFLSTNSAVNLRTSLIENALIDRGFYDGKK